MASRSTWTRRIGPSVLGATFLVTALLSGGYYESTYSLLAAGIWLGLAAASALVPLRRPSLAAWALLALTGWTVASALWGPAGPAFRVAPLAALYAGALIAAEQVDGHALLRLVWLGCATVAGAALVARATGLAPELAGQGDRLAWPLGYANGLGLVAMFGLLLSLRERGRRAAAAGAVSAAAALLTFSRTALLAGLVGLLVAAALSDRVPRRVALAGALGVAALALLLAQPLAARFAAPAPDRGDSRRLLDVSGHGRAELWRVAWREGRDHPVAGGGAGSWARTYVRERPVAAPANAHSLELETFAELGLVGVGLLLLFGIAVLRPGGRDPLAAGVVAAWATAASADWTWQLPAATLPALFAAAALTGGRLRVATTQSLLFAVAALALGTACALHGTAAALLEEGKPRAAARLLPFDARPWVALGERAHACRVDPGDPSIGGCNP